MVRFRLEGFSFMEGVWVNKPLLSAEMVTGGVHMAQCCILAMGNAAAAAKACLLELSSPATGH